MSETWSEHFRLAAKKAVEENHFCNSEGCWIWLGRRQAGKEYGVAYLYGVTIKAHRLSWFAEFGPVPEGKHVLHKCDVPLCINPAHLFLGTHQENMADRNAKGRAKGPKGESAPKAKLKAKDAIAVRKMREKGYSTKTIAAIFAVSKTTIERIINRKTWTHV